MKVWWGCVKTCPGKSACCMDTERAYVGSGSETQTREAFRRFVLTAIEPLALIVSRELTRVFEVPVELDLSELAHADIAGRARAYKSRGRALVCRRRMLRSS